MCGVGGRWRLYEEKWVLSGEGKYNASRPLTWRKDLVDYMAGRCSDMDSLILWIESQDDEIDDDCDIGSAPMISHAPSLKEVSKQLWAFLQPLVKHDSSVSGTFANCLRHNGFEVWRRIAEPINEDKAMVRRHLLPLVTNPRGAASVDKIEAAIGEWDTNCRLFAEADGPAQDEQSRRISLVSMLPKEVNAHISMHWDLPEYRTYTSLKKYIIKYVKTIINLNKSIKPVHAVVPQQEVEPPPELPMTEEDEAAQAALMERLVHTDDPTERAEICAVMRNRGFRAPTRGQGGQRQRTTTARYMPPRDLCELRQSRPYCS